MMTANAKATQGSPKCGCVQVYGEKQAVEGEKQKCE